MWQVCVTGPGFWSPCQWGSCLSGSLGLSPSSPFLFGWSLPGTFPDAVGQYVFRCSVWAEVSCQAVLCFSGITPGYTLIVLWLVPSLPHYLLICVFIVIIKLKMLESSVMSSNQNFWQHSLFWASICVRLWFNACLSHYLHWEGRLRSVGLAVLALSLLQPRSACTHSREVVLCPWAPAGGGQLLTSSSWLLHTGYLKEDHSPEHRW